ncbi:MAG: RNA polymerase factor sigma-32 [Syntrophorhabdales bacterium]
MEEIEKEGMLKERGSLPASYDPLKQYLTEVSRYPLLSREEEKALAELVYRQKDKEAARTLILSNLKLVVKIALGYYNTYMNVRDLIQEGNIGLMQAVKKYNPYKGTKFSTYASFWIRAYMLKYIRNNWSLVKIGTTESEKKLFYGLEKEKRRLEAKGIIPVPQLLASNLDVKQQDIEDMERRLSMADVSLDQPAYEEGEETMMDMVKSDGNIEDMVEEREKKKIAALKIAEFRGMLNERELYIFEHRIMTDEPMTLQEIGDHFNISRERARQIEKGVSAKVSTHLIGSGGKRPAASKRENVA